MNGTEGVWKTTKDLNSGREYYYKVGTSDTAWTKPDSLLTPAQLATGWTQTSHSDGKPYWFKKDDKTQTSWTAPAGWEDAPAPSEYVTSQLMPYPSRDQQQRDSRGRDEYRDRPSYNDRRDDGDRRERGGYTGPLAATPAGADYGSESERQAAFVKLMRKVGVQPDWTWAKAMRASIQDPAFRAISEPSARKEAFEKFQDDVKAQEKEREKERVTKLRNDFRTMLARHPEIKHYTRWKNARPIIEDEVTFRSTDDDEERQKLFTEYVVELKQKHEEKRYKDHQEAMKEVAGLLRDVNLSPETRWEDAHKQLQSHPEFANDEKYRTLTKSEILDTFKSQIQRMWEDVNTIKQREKVLKARQKRKARDGFLDLLSQLKDDEQLKPDTTWSEIYPLIKDDARYTTLLKNCGTANERDDESNPQDLFFDTLEEFEHELYEVRRLADIAIKDARFKFGPKTSLDEFMQVVSHDDRLSSFKKSLLEAAFKRLQQHAADYEEEMVRDEKRQQRKIIDALRSRIKRLEPPVRLEDTWDEVRLRIEKYDEYNALQSDDDREAAFDKHMSRLQDDEKDRSRRHERERTREDRHRDSRRDRRRSRDPDRETDPYEADRRRATEQRERQFRHASNGGLSPPPRERRADRHDRDDRRERQGSISRYDRERREREAERERAYISRADPFAKPSELDYGESSDGPSRPDSSHGKRAGSDTGSRRAAKRPRTERGVRNGGSETPAAAPTTEPHEEPALQSGSEEGEIEEV